MGKLVHQGLLCFIVASVAPGYVLQRPEQKFWQRRQQFAAERFKRVKELFAKSYSPFGRQVSNVTPEDVFMDFEIQFGNLDMTPDLLIEQTYFTLHGESCDAGGPLFDNNQFKFMNWGPDGHATARQFVGASLEGTTKRFMRPRELLHSGVLEEVTRFIQKANHKGAVIPGTKGRVTMGKPFQPGLQYTVGLHLSKIPVLLKYSLGKDIWQRTEKRCREHPVLYQSLVAIAAMIVRAVSRDHPSGSAFPKSYIEPWMVRTHVGDIAKYVESQLGRGILANLHDDVLAVSGARPESKAFPNGVIDYLRFSEFAEIGGFVVGRDPLRNSYAEPDRDMPKTVKGICRVAEKILERNGTEEVLTFITDDLRMDKLLLKLGRGIYPANVCALKASQRQADVCDETLATPSKWLRGLVEGHDFWTDAESILAKQAMSGMMFKSMGSWRMMNSSGFVYLESRKRRLDSELDGTSGFGIPRPPSKEPAQWIREIATAVDALPL